MEKILSLLEEEYEIPRPKIELVHDSTASCYLLSDKTIKLNPALAYETYYYLLKNKKYTKASPYYSPLYFTLIHEYMHYIQNQRGYLTAIVMIDLSVIGIWKNKTYTFVYNRNRANDYEYYKLPWERNANNETVKFLNKHSLFI